MGTTTRLTLGASLLLISLASVAHASAKAVVVEAAGAAAHGAVAKAAVHEQVPQADAKPAPIMRRVVPDTLAAPYAGGKSISLGQIATQDDVAALGAVNQAAVEGDIVNLRLATTGYVDKRVMQVVVHASEAAGEATHAEVTQLRSEVKLLEDQLASVREQIGKMQGDLLPQDRSRLRDAHKSDEQELLEEEELHRERSLDEGNNPPLETLGDDDDAADS